MTFVTFRWVYDSVQAQTLLQPDVCRGHVLRRPRPHLVKNGVFRDVRMYLFGSDTFRASFSTVVEAAGALVVDEIETQASMAVKSKHAVGQTETQKYLILCRRSRNCCHGVP